MPADIRRNFRNTPKAIFNVALGRPSLPDTAFDP